MTVSPAPSFLVGCGRSGTSLLRGQLNAHPLLAEQLRDARSIHLVRDPRAVVSSLIRSDVHRNTPWYGARRWAMDVQAGLAAPMRHATRLFATLLEPFRTGPRIDLRLLGAYILINGLVLVNAYFHDPWIGYDSSYYFSYIRVLSEGRLVTRQESREFFSPPLPFAIPAVLMATTGMDVAHSVRFGQALNVVLSVCLTWYLLKVCRRLGSGSTLGLGALVLLGILPVYYKSFALVRGEPFVACFAVIILDSVTLMIFRRQFTPVNAIILGLCMGLSALSRQWGLLLVPPVLLLLGYFWIRLPTCRSSIAGVVGLSLVVASLVSGWFYIHLWSSYSSFTPFNRPPAAKFSFQNQPSEFYFGLSPELLFRAPVRPNFANQLIPIFYSEIWGDYWCYFSIASTDSRSSNHIAGRRLAAILETDSRPPWLITNYETMGAYLGRVNIVSLFPTFLALISLGVATGITLGRQVDTGVIPNHRAVLGFLLITIILTLAGYMWFLIMYPSIRRGDTIKATYVLHLFPMVAITVGYLLERIEERSRLLYRSLIGMLCAVFLHNLPAMVTHF
jgi:4-amino-4-deoxy-L-arabinose transferase-like glycosyltransferase